MLLQQTFRLENDQHKPIMTWFECRSLVFRDSLSCDTLCKGEGGGVEIGKGVEGRGRGCWSAEGQDVLRGEGMGYRDE